MILRSARERLLPPIEARLQEVLAERAQPAPPTSLRGGRSEPVRSAPDLAPQAPGHYGMMRYHLGWLDEQLSPVEAPTGKRLRPLLCALATEACGGEARRAVPIAVALELLHNFTLIHDDIEDGDQIRHHRPTVWKLWGEAQAINAGDGMHVLAYTALLELRRCDVPDALVTNLLQLMASTSLIITEGQHLDLAFERRDDVTPADYLDMIGRKSAALLSAATAMGALVAEAPAAAVDALGEYGYQLGMAFQIRDDVLGIWGTAETTGKPANDLKRRKKTLPSIYALARAEEADRQALRHLFECDQPSDDEVALATGALERCGAHFHCEQMVSRYSTQARTALHRLAPGDAREALDALVRQLETRSA